MAKLIVRDKSEQIKQVFDKVAQEHFKDASLLRWLFTWRTSEEPEYDKENQAILASVRKLPTRERDVYRRDVELRVWRDYWKNLNEKQQYRILFHELCHIQIEYDEDFNVCRDTDDRIKFVLTNHDLLLQTFKKEIEIFGLSSEHVEVAEFLSDQLGNRDKQNDEA